MAVSGFVAVGQIVGGRWVGSGLVEKREGREERDGEVGQDDAEEVTDEEAVRGNEGD